MKSTILVVVVFITALAMGDNKDSSFKRPKHLTTYKSAYKNTTDLEPLSDKPLSKSQPNPLLQEKTLSTSSSSDNPVKTSRILPKSLSSLPPDLQFGLAFTVPFVSLSTDKLLNGLGHGKKNTDSVSNILKLNVGGLILAAVVGVAAIFLIPGLINKNSVFDVVNQFLPNHFNQNNYNDNVNNFNNQGEYNSGFDGGYNYNNEGFNQYRKKDSRQAKQDTANVIETIKTRGTACMLKLLCYKELNLVNSKLMSGLSDFVTENEFIDKGEINKVKEHVKVKGDCKFYDGLCGV